MEKINMQKEFVSLNPNREVVQKILEKIRNNDGYCPCQLEKTPETKCMCENFRQQDKGYCHCGLYIKH